MIFCLYKQRIEVENAFDAETLMFELLGIAFVFHDIQGYNVDKMYCFSKVLLFFLQEQKQLLLFSFSCHLPSAKTNRKSYTFAFSLKNLDHHLQKYFTFDSSILILSPTHKNNENHFNYRLLQLLFFPISYSFFHSPQINVKFLNEIRRRQIPHF